MPWRLYRYILGEMLRQVVLTTAILVTIIAFGAVIKPLAGDSVFTTGQALKYVLLAMVPMLQYALPFAGGFAATLTMHRLASDNEVVAMSTCGMSYRAIFAPILGFGVVLLIIMMILTQAVIPKFFGLMAATISGDIKQLISTSIDRGVPFEFNDLQIYAEGFESVPHPDTGADERILLRRVVASQVDEHGLPISDVTAAGAVIDLYERDQATLMKIALVDTVSWDASSNSLRGFPRLEPTHAIPIPRPDRSDPEQLTRWELARARAHPERSLMVEKVRFILLGTINDTLVSQSLNDRLAQHGELVVRKAGPIERLYRIHADTVQDGVLMRTDGGPIVILETAGGEPSRRFLADHAVFHRQAIFGPLGELFRLEMDGVDVESLTAPLRPNRRDDLTMTGLDAAGDATQWPPDTSLRVLLDEAETLRASSPSVHHAIEFVKIRIQELMGRIDAQVIRRNALSFTACLLLVLGAMLAVVFRNMPPLGVYLWAFLPALLNLILIASGTGMVRHGDLVGGLILAWSGNGLLAILIVLAYFKVNRN